jgi:hypothetical protein
VHALAAGVPILLLLAAGCAGSARRATSRPLDLGTPSLWVATVGGTAERFAAALKPLEDAGIPHRGVLGPGGIEIWVAGADYARAREILARDTSGLVRLAEPR